MARPFAQLPTGSQFKPAFKVGSGPAPLKPGFAPAPFVPRAVPPQANEPAPVQAMPVAPKPSVPSRPMPPSVQSQPPVPPRVNPPPKLTETEASQVMEHIKAEMVVRSNIDLDLQSKMAQARECLDAEMPGVVRSFQEECGKETQSFKGYADHRLTSISEASQYAAQAKQEVAKASFNPVTSPPLDTGEMAHTIADAIDTIKRNISSMQKNTGETYSNETSKLANFATEQWAEFEQVYGAVGAKLEEVKAKYPHLS